MGTYEIGQVARLKTWSDLVPGFTDITGALADPTTVSLEVTDPNKVATTYIFNSSAIVKVSVGKYYFDLGPFTTSGRWKYRWIGAGGIVTAKKNSLVVQSND